MNLHDNITELYYRISFGVGIYSAYSQTNVSSSNGRTTGFEPVNLGSIPRDTAKECRATNPAYGTIVDTSRNNIDIERGSLRWLNKATVRLFVAFDFYTRTGIRACRYISDALNNSICRYGRVAIQGNRAFGLKYIHQVGSIPTIDANYPTTNVLNLLLLGEGIFVLCIAHPV